MKPPAGMRLPDTSHLCEADAELLAALYVERNGVSRRELETVRKNRNCGNSPVESQKCDSARYYE